MRFPLKKHTDTNAAGSGETADEAEERQSDDCSEYEDSEADGGRNGLD